MSRDEVFTTLRSVADVALAGSMVIFDYFDAKTFVPKKTATHTKEIREKLRQIGEPMKTGLDPSTLSADLADLGLQLQENLGPADIQNRYFLERMDYRAAEHVYYAQTVVE